MRPGVDQLTWILWPFPLDPCSQIVAIIYFAVCYEQHFRKTQYKLITRQTVIKNNVPKHKPKLFVYQTHQAWTWLCQTAVQKVRKLLLWVSVFSSPGQRPGHQVSTGKQGAPRHTTLDFPQAMAFPRPGVAWTIHKASAKSRWASKWGHVYSGCISQRSSLVARHAERFPRRPTPWQAPIPFAGAPGQQPRTPPAWRRLPSWLLFAGLLVVYLKVDWPIGLRLTFEIKENILSSWAVCSFSFSQITPKITFLKSEYQMIKVIGTLVEDPR